MATIIEYREFFLNMDNVNIPLKPKMEPSFSKTVEVDGITIGRIFLNGHRPDQDVFSKLFQSIVFKLNPEDWATVTNRGIVRLAGFNDISTPTEESLTAATTVRNLPKVLQGTNSTTLGTTGNLTFPNLPNNIVQVTEQIIDARTDYTINANAEFLEWLRNAFTAVDTRITNAINQAVNGVAPTTYNFGAENGLSNVVSGTTSPVQVNYRFSGGSITVPSVIFNTANTSGFRIGTTSIMEVRDRNVFLSATSTSNMTRSFLLSDDTNNGGTTLNTSSFRVGAPLSPSTNVMLRVEGTVQASGDFVSSSDERLKTSITPFVSALHLIDRIGTYTYKKIGSDRREYGVLAQEIKEIFPNLVYEDSEGYLAVAYDKLTVILIAALKELLHEQNKK